MAEIVNLRRARKARAHAERESEAAANRAKHGRSKAEKAREEAQRNKRGATLDQAKRDKSDS